MPNALRPSTQNAITSQQGNLKRVGIWLRVSTVDQVKGESPEHHEQRGRAYALLKDWNVVEVYRLDAVSGRTVKEHPEAKRMLADIKAGHISGLIFSKLARLARNTKELLEFADFFREHDAHLVSLAESIDTSSPAGRLFYTIIAAMAQWEREEIAERVAASIPIRAKLGKPLGGAAPFGYRWYWRGKEFAADVSRGPAHVGAERKQDQKLIPDPDEAPIRKRVYELFREHKRLRTVARLLNEAGFRTRNGSRFSDTTVSRLIQDPTAKGISRANYTRAVNETKRWTLKPESEWVHHAVEAIVTEELWSECNAILQTRKCGTKPSRKPAHLFGGLTFCACGTKMYLPTNSPKYTCSRCRQKISSDFLEEAFRERLGHFFAPGSQIAAHLSRAKTVIEEKRGVLSVLERELTKLCGDIDSLHDGYRAGAVDTARFAEQYCAMSERLEMLKKTIPRAQAELDVMRINHLSHEQVVAEARDLHASWTGLPLAVRQRIVEAITERIIVAGGHVRITLFCDP